MKQFFLTHCFLFILNFVYAQNEGNIWTFGENIGLDFNSGSPIPFSGTAMNTFEGCATISNSSGQLLFYTDGILVWDKNHNLMPSVTNLGGNSSSSQSAIIVPQPGNTTLYYIFTVDATIGSTGGSGGLQYSIIDISLNSGLGDVTSQNILLATPTCEKITAIKKSNGIDYWIVTHLYNSNTFKSYSLTSSGLNLVPVTSSSGTIITDVGSLVNNESIGYMKASSNGAYIGVVSYINLNLFELFNFNNFTGMITGLVISDNNFPVASIALGDGIYGISFSPDNSKVYVGQTSFDLTSDPSVIFQYDLSSGNSSSILASKNIIYSTNSSTLGALQLGVDGKIYIARIYEAYLDVISTPNNLGTSCNYNTSAITLTGICNAGLPNIYEGFLVENALQATLFYQGCTGNDYQLFIDTLLNDTYTLHWDFGDVNSTFDTSNILNPTFNFPGPGNYTVVLTINKTSGGSFSVSQIITIGGVLPLNIGTDTTICLNSSLQLNSGINNAVYTWSPSLTLSCVTCNNPVASPTTKTTYTVTISTLYCSGTDSIIVDLYPATTALAFSDTSICIGTSALLSATGGISYYWWPDVELSNNIDQVITATPTSNTTYFVEVSGGHGCKTDTASVIVSILPLPIVDAGSDITLTEGQIGVLNGSSNGIFNIWQPDYGLNNINILDPTFTAITSIKYTLFTTDLNGCIFYDSMYVNVEPAFLLFPNSFSPNEDGTNDLFNYFTKGIASIQLSIYNRWGELVYFSTEMNDFWDGKQNELLCPMGVFIYIAKARTWSGREISVNGNVTIIK